LTDLDRLSAQLRDALGDTNDLLMEIDETRHEVALGRIWDALQAALTFVEGQLPPADPLRAREQRQSTEAS
jgi:hypothetical protein